MYAAIVAPARQQTSSAIHEKKSSFIAIFIAFHWSQTIYNIWILFNQSLVTNVEMIHRRVICVAPQSRRYSLYDCVHCVLDRRWQTLKCFLVVCRSSLRSAALCCLPAMKHAALTCDIVFRFVVQNEKRSRSRKKSTKFSELCMENGIWRFHAVFSNM